MTVHTVYLKHVPVRL